VVVEAFTDASASRYTVILEVITTGTGPTKVSTLGPGKLSTEVFFSLHAPAAEAMAFSDAFASASAVRLACSRPPNTVQLPFSAIPALNAMLCVICAFTLPEHVTVALVCADG
jgi:hypothetical protein